MRQAVHIQRGVVTGSRKYVSIMLRFREASVEAVDGCDQAAGHCIQVSALACCQVHGGSKRIGGLLCFQAGTGEVQGSCRRILHPEGGICGGVLHGFVQKPRLLLRISHRLIGELHGLIDLGKARHTCGTHSGKWKRDMRCQGLARALHLAAEFLHLLPGCRHLLCLHGTEILILLLQAFQLLLSLSDLPLQCIILLFGDRAVFERLVCLLGRFLQCVQLLLCRLDLLLQSLILLGQQIGISGIHLEKLVDILQLGFRITDLGVDALEGGFELSAVAV